MAYISDYETQYQGANRKMLPGMSLSMRFAKLMECFQLVQTPNEQFQGKMLSEVGRPSSWAFREAPGKVASASGMSKGPRLGHIFLSTRTRASTPKTIGPGPVQDKGLPSPARDFLTRDVERICDEGDELDALCHRAGHDGGGGGGEHVLEEELRIVVQSVREEL